MNVRFTIYSKTLNHEANDTEQIALLHSLLELQDQLGRAIQTHNLTLEAANVTSATEASNDTSRGASSVLVVGEHHLEQPVLVDCAFGYVTVVGYYMTEICGMLHMLLHLLVLVVVVVVLLILLLLLLLLNLLPLVPLDSHYFCDCVFCMNGVFCASCSLQASVVLGSR